MHSVVGRDLNLTSGEARSDSTGITLCSVGAEVDGEPVGMWRERMGDLLAHPAWPVICASTRERVSGVGWARWVASARVWGRTRLATRVDHCTRRTMWAVSLNHGDSR